MIIAPNSSVPAKLKKKKWTMDTTTTTTTAAAAAAAAATTTTTNEKIQTVAFLRHGVAKHNLPDKTTGHHPDLTSETLFDPSLVHHGKRQAIDAGESLKIFWHTTKLGEQIQLIITSPLTRCIQTSLLGFLPGESYNENNNNKYDPPFLCVDLLREAYGCHYPDKRRTKSQLQQKWPMIHFDTNMTEDDIDWSPTQRESTKNLKQRINLFLQHLSKRPETNIVVVSHGVWIEYCFHLHCPEALDHGKQRVYNCDAFVGECVSVNGNFIRLQNMRKIN